MNKKKLNKTVWYSSELDENKNPILPPIADSPTDLNGLHEGEIFLHNSDEDPSIWIRTSSGKIQRLKGTGENVPFWELMTDENGNKYIFTKYHLVTQLGLTMYSGEDGLNLPSIYDGLPIDSQTIYWEDIKDGNGVVIGKILKAKTGGGTLGSLTNVGEWADSVADVDRIMVQKKGSDTWEAMDVSGIGSASFENISESGEGNAYTSFELSEDKKFLTLVKGETFALASDLENKWATDEELINNWNTAFGWGNHAEAGYALQTSLDLVSEKLNNFLEGSDTDSIINKWKELEVFLGGLTESDNLAEILATKANQSALEETNRTLATKWTKDDTKIANWDAAFSWGDHSKAGYAAKSYVDSTFVTIAGNEDVTGVHNFVNGLKIGGKLIDKPQDDVIYIDANLVVRGGITMYGDRDANIPSILNSIPTAGYDDIQARGLIAFNSKHFVINNGVVSAIQGSSGLDVEQLDNYLKNNHYATEDWVKEYIVEINTGETVNITQQMVIDALGYTPYDASNPNGYITSATLDGYLPLTGGSINIISDEGINVNRTNGTRAILSFKVDGGYKGGLGIDTDGVPFYRTYIGKIHTLIHSGNIGSQSVNYATTAGNAEKFAGVDFATLVSIIPTNTNQLENGAGFITSSGYSAGVTDYYDGTSNISIGYQSSSLTASQIDYIAAYSIASGNIVIKDVDKSTMQSWLGLGSFAYKSSLAFSELTSKPTTISGYGITDAITTSNIGSQSVNYATSSGSCTGNAASATKLSDNTSFTIWGQEFFVNGKPKSVNGAFRLLREIPGTVVIHKALVYPTSPYGLITRAYIDGDISLQVQREDNDSECFNLLLNPLGGNVGIGTTSPAYPLDVNGTVRASDYRFKRGTDGADTMSLYSPSNTTTFALENRAGAGSILFSLNVGGRGNKEVGKFNGGDGTFEVKGNALIGGGITMYSQLSLKDVVDERGLSLSELSTIKPTRYTWKDGRDNKIHIGGIADDIQQVLPEVVYKTEEGVLTMDYGNAGFAIAASLIKPVVDHEQRIKALEKENELLKQELNRLRA